MQLFIIQYKSSAVAESHLATIDVGEKVWGLTPMLQTGQDNGPIA